ncbi:hypothetical protein IFR05_014826 [Cadophora sp. M221]|nr:hypothetical protein IFR05_014826 [Cadophora sp. M221]
MGLLVPLVQILVAQTTFCLNATIPEPTITQELFDEHSDSAVLAAAQKRTATRLNDQIYGIFGVMPKHLVQGIAVSYERQFSGLFLELLLGLIRSGDHSMLGCAQSLSVGNEGIPRWLPGFGNIKPLKGPCKQPGKSQITAQGLQVSVFVLGCVENCIRLTEVDFGQLRFSELGAEASLAMNGLHFTGGVWDQRKTYKVDYDGEYLREIKRIVLEEAEERGGLWEIQLQVVDSGDIKTMLAWAPEEIPKQALAIVRCLDKDPGSIGVVTQYPDGWVTVGGLFGGLDKGCEALLEKDILLMN